MSFLHSVPVKGCVQAQRFEEFARRLESGGFFAPFEAKPMKHFNFTPFLTSVCGRASLSYGRLRGWNFYTRLGRAVSEQVRQHLGLCNKRRRFQPGATAKDACRRGLREDRRPSARSRFRRARRLPVTLDTTVGSDTQPRRGRGTAHLSRAVTRRRRRPCCPTGSRVTGVVTDATRSGKVKGRAHVAVRFNAVTAAHGDDERYR